MRRRYKFVRRASSSSADGESKPPCWTHSRLSGSLQRLRRLLAPVSVVRHAIAERPVLTLQPLPLPAPSLHRSSGQWSVSSACSPACPSQWMSRNCYIYIYIYIYIFRPMHSWLSRRMLKTRYSGLSSTSSKTCRRQYRLYNPDSIYNGVLCPKEDDVITDRDSRNASDVGYISWDRLPLSVCSSVCPSVRISKWKHWAHYSVYCWQCL